jgi:hypothetical protein
MTRYWAAAAVPSLWRFLWAVNKEFQVFPLLPPDPDSEIGPFTFNSGAENQIDSDAVFDGINPKNWRE